eukprot:12052623-Alexandrium_andersonii.AAC.1
MQGSDWVCFAVFCAAYSGGPWGRGLRGRSECGAPGLPPLRDVSGREGWRGPRHHCARCGEKLQ